MKRKNHSRYWALLPIALAAQISTAAPSTEPAQSPLLKRTSSVRPNVIIMLDDSGSMNQRISVGTGTNRYWTNRWKAVRSALNTAITKPKYDDEFRLGYGVINTDRLIRGVRPFTRNGKQEFLTWLNGQANPRYDAFHNYGSAIGGSTPLHQGVLTAGEYLRGKPPGTKWYVASPTGTAPEKSYPWPWWENGKSKYTYKPWDNSKYDATKLSCRSASLILLSDGEWNDYGTYNEYSGPYGLFEDKLYPAGYTQSDESETWSSKPGPTFSGIKNGKPTTLAYNPWGDTNNRELYTPYGDFGKSKRDDVDDFDKAHFFEKKLSDLTAYYYWHTDLRPDMANDVVTGGPTFWQNMKTYTINFQVPLSRHLSYKQISDYESAWLSGANRRELVRAKPGWTPGRTFAGNRQQLQDDTIQAGFTGGGRGYSPSTAEELETVFDTILNDAIFGGRGNDAGVAISGSPVYDSTGLVNRNKYLVEYDALKNAGDLLAYALTNEGDYRNVSGNGAPIPRWRASERLPSPENRNLYLLDPSGIRYTLTTNTALSSSTVGAGNYAAINGTGRFADNTAFAGFMLGKSGEKAKNGDLFRPLPKIGAIVNSPPLFISYSNGMQYAKTKARTHSLVQGNLEYNDYFTQKYNSKALIYAPANSGLVHAFNAESNLSAGGSTVPEGQEMAAYLPNSIMPKLDKLSQRDYTFEYLTDGPLIEQDIYDSSAKKWRQILFGTGGRGGQFMYALESRIGANGVRKPEAKDFLWEKSKNTSADTANMAYMTNPATAGQLLNGQWVTLTNSGHYPAIDSSDPSKSQKIGLYVLNALTGEKINFIPLPANYQAGNRGLGGVTAVRNVGRRIVAAYAGDAKGNLWRFDLRPSQMKVSYGKPLFTAPSGQPIYAAPAWQRHMTGGVKPNGKSCVAPPPAKEGQTVDREAYAKCGTIVAIGTGILLDNGDTLNTGKQSLYGIWDPTPVIHRDKAGEVIEEEKFTTVPVSSLLTQTLLTSSTGGQKTALLKVSTHPVNYKDSSKTLHRGWKLELDALGNLTDGERVIATPKNIGISFFFSSVVVNNRKGPESCSAIREFPNLLYGLDAMSGGRGKKAAFDNKPDGASVAYMEEGGFTRGNQALIKSDTDASLEKLLDTYTGPDNEQCLGCDPCDAKTKKELEAQIQAVGGKLKYYALCQKGDPLSWRRSWRQIMSVPSN